MLRKTLLIVRCSIEGLLGAAMLLCAVIPIPPPSAGGSGWSDFLSNLTGALVARLIVAACGFALCRDSLKVYRRIRTQPAV